ncbi:response regulator [Thermodesulfovibrio sp. 3907-1M]|uniref:Response regulator n=1 Tax=Thermodesulfovibrio autotrophicus TaxID=3118333 RepID=A0AAU8GUT6_9BACT
MHRILVAEDSVTDAKYIESILKEGEYELFFAKDGEEAEELIKKENFDLVILDVVMPKKNGFQICREIKKNEKTKDIPVIIVSSKKEEADKFWGKQQGADEYITKPFEPIDLLVAIKRCLKK